VRNFRDEKTTILEPADTTQTPQFHHQKTTKIHPIFQKPPAKTALHPRKKTEKIT
jgi:hypothetical protein